MGPADAVAKWLEVSGKPRRVKEETKANEKDVQTASAPPATRKRSRAEPNRAATDSASAPPTKKLKHTLRDRPPSPSERSPLVRSGPYAKAGATQVGWLMYINGVQLKMPTSCTNCARDKTPCSGMPGQRCGRCRFKKRWCSHSNTGKSPRVYRDSEEDEAEGSSNASPTAPKTKSTSRRLQQKSATKGKGARPRFSA
jgi:hypothetical protein